MTSDLYKDTHSAGDRARSRTYVREFLPGILGYVVVLGAVLVWGHLEGHSPWRYVWAVLPVVPALWIVRAVLRHLRRVDDYQRLLLLQGLGVGFAVAMITALTLGFLGIAGLSMAGAGWIMYSAGMFGWLVASQLAARR
jgi:hypothetical protein